MMHCLISPIRRFPATKKGPTGPFAAFPYTERMPLSTPIFPVLSQRDLAMTFLPGITAAPLRHGYCGKIPCQTWCSGKLNHSLLISHIFLVYSSKEIFYVFSDLKIIFIGGFPITKRASYPTLVI
jgi:hypothetical protein